MVAVISFVWIFDATGWGINPTDKDVAIGVKFVKTADDGEYWVFFTEPLEPIDLKGKDREEICENPRVVWVDTADSPRDPRTFRLASEMGKAPHGI